jgi:hypothetical protein
MHCPIVEIRSILEYFTFVKKRAQEICQEPCYPAVMLYVSHSSQSVVKRVSLVHDPMTVATEYDGRVVDVSGRWSDVSIVSVVVAEPEAFAKL